MNCIFKLFFSFSLPFILSVSLALAERKGSSSSVLLDGRSPAAKIEATEDSNTLDVGQETGALVEEALSGIPVEDKEQTLEAIEEAVSVGYYTKKCSEQNPPVRACDSADEICCAISSGTCAQSTFFPGSFVCKSKCDFGKNYCPDGSGNPNNFSCCKENTEACTSNTDKNGKTTFKCSAVKINTPIGEGVQLCSATGADGSPQTWFCDQGKTCAKENGTCCEKGFYFSSGSNTCIKQDEVSCPVGADGKVSSCLFGSEVCCGGSCCEVNKGESCVEGKCKVTGPPVTPTPQPTPQPPCEITVYSPVPPTVCVFCKVLKDELQTSNVKFTPVDISNEKAMKDFGTEGFPITVIECPGREKIVDSGYIKGRIKALTER